MLALDHGSQVLTPRARTHDPIHARYKTTAVIGNDTPQPRRDLALMHTDSKVPRTFAPGLPVMGKGPAWAGARPVLSTLQPATDTTPTLKEPHHRTDVHATADHRDPLNE